MNMGFAGGDGAAPEPVVTPAPGGVKKRPVIRLSENDNRANLADFIKSHLASSRVEQDAPKQTVYKSGKRTKQQIEDERIAELAMRNMEREAEDEVRKEYNNNAILLILMAAMDD
jgi:hypothetical protein